MKQQASVTPLRPAARSPLTFTVALAPEAEQQLAEAIAAKVAEQLHSAPAPALLDRSELAQALGISVATVDRLVQEGLPRVRLVETHRHCLSDALAWLKGRGAT